MKLRQLTVLLVALSTMMIACGQINIYEKTVTVPAHAWSSSFKPGFDFDITDSSSVYQVFLVIRHTEQYRYNNIYLNLRIKGPGNDSALVLRREIKLANNERWLGEGMDDIYEHRTPIGLLGDTKALTPGTYHFTLEQIMREDPLDHVLDVGLRVEKK